MVKLIQVFQSFRLVNVLRYFFITKSMRGLYFIFYFLVCPIWLPVFFFYNEPELGAEIDPGMALTPLPSSIGRDRIHNISIVSQVLYR